MNATKQRYDAVADIHVGDRVGTDWRDFVDTGVVLKIADVPRTFHPSVSAEFRQLWGHMVYVEYNPVASLAQPLRCWEAPELLYRAQS